MLALLLPLILAMPQAEARDAADLLAKIRKLYTASPSVRATFVETYAPAGFAAASPETGLVTLQAPDQVRFDYDGSDGKVFTFDGKAGRQYVESDKQLVVRNLTTADRERLPVVFFDTPEAILSRYTATVKAALTGVDELSLVPKEEGLPSLDLLVAGTGEVKRLLVRDASGNTTTFTFTRMAAGRKRPASDFTLVPPKGTKVVSD
jgi:outer membrane lipoprotein-sorting protein